MSSRVVVALIVTLVSACGGGSRSSVAAPSMPTVATAEWNAENDYVVGPITSASGTDHEVRTYYIVRN